MARTVADAAVLLDGAWPASTPRDPARRPAAAKMRRDYTQSLVPAASQARGSASPRKRLFGGSTHADRPGGRRIAVMKSLGAEIIDPVELAVPDEFGKSEFEVLLYEFKADLNAYLARLGPDARVKSLKDAIAFNEANKDREMPYFGQEIFVQAAGKGPAHRRPTYVKALGDMRPHSRARGHRRRDDQAQARRARRADQRRPPA